MFVCKGGGGGEGGGKMPLQYIFYLRIFLEGATELNWSK